MGTPSASIATLAAGAGHGEAGDAPYQGPAQEPIAIETLAVSPKSANQETANSDAEAAPSNTAVVAFEGAPSKADGRVTVRPKPEKRKNAKERAKEKFKKKDASESAKDGTTPTTAKAKSGTARKADKTAESKPKKGRAAGKAA